MVLCATTATVVAVGKFEREKAKLNFKSKFDLPFDINIEYIGPVAVEGVTIAGSGLVLAGSAVGNMFSVSISKSESSNTNSSKGDSETSQKQNPTKEESEVWKNLDNVKGQDRKTSGTGRNKRYYEWDHTHNDIEVYDRKEKHLGSMDPTTGEMYKPTVPGRSIDVN